MIKYILCLLLINACGFYSFNGSSISPSIKTVSINYFSNNANTIRSSLSPMFTEELKNIFVNQTNLDLIETNGDLSFSGKITSYTITPISIQSDQTAQQNRLTIKVNVQFENKEDKNMNFNTNFSRHKDFDSNADLSLIEDDLMQVICEELAEDIFNKSVVNW